MSTVSLAEQMNPVAHQHMHNSRDKNSTVDVSAEAGTHLDACMYVAAGLFM